MTITSAKIISTYFYLKCSCPKSQIKIGFFGSLFIRVTIPHSLQHEVIELEKAIEQEVDKEQKKVLRRQKSEKKKQVKAIREDYLSRLEKYEQHR